MTQQPPYQPPQQPQHRPAPEPSDLRTLAVLSHLSSPLCMLLSVGSLSFLGPLIFWAVYRTRPGYEFVKACSAQAFNFNLLLWVANVLGAILTLVTFGLGVFAAIPLWIATTVLAFVFHIIGAVRANRGEVYHYPLQIKVLR